jgi:hypothetical protein
VGFAESIRNIDFAHKEEYCSRRSQRLNLTSLLLAYSLNPALNVSDFLLGTKVFILAIVTART